MTAIAAQSYVLRKPVLDLEDFAAHQSEYLVDLYEQPEKAVHLWKEQVSDHGVAEGFVQLQYWGQNLFHLKLWDETAGIWFILVEVIDEYLGHIAAGNPRFTVERLFPDQPVPVRLERKAGSTILTVDQHKVRVDPDEFFSGVLKEADRFYQWTEEHLNNDEADIRGRIAARLNQIG